MHIFIADICDTAYVRDMADEEIIALCDYLNEAIKTSSNKVVKLRWRTQTARARKLTFLIVTRYWVTPLGIRKLRIQCHRVHENGRIGSRELVEERRQGRVVR